MQLIDNLKDNFSGYAELLRKIKLRVQVAQQRAIYAVNEEMLLMYWDIGKMLQQSQDADGWGQKTLQRLSVDLKNDYSEIKGFTVRNMQYMIQFFNEYNQELTMVKSAESSIAQSMVTQLDSTSKPITKPVVSQLSEYNFTLPVKQLSWSHNLVLIKQVKDIRARYWYMVLGAGFAFMGRQYYIEVSGGDYYIDILMYNAFLHRYLVIELKDTEFMPEYIGKLNFYRGN